MRALTPPLAGSQGSVEVQSTLVFGHGNDTVASDAAEQQLRRSLDQDGFIMDLQLASIQSERELRAGGTRGGAQSPVGLLWGALQALPHPSRGGHPGLPVGQAHGFATGGASQFPSACGGQHWEDHQDPMEEGSSPHAPSRGSLRAVCPGQPRGSAQWSRRSSGPLSGTVVTSPAPVPVVPDWAIALLVLVCILLLLSILTCLLMVSPPSPSLSSPAFCWWVPRPRPRAFSSLTPSLSPHQDHLHLPSEKPREAGPVQHEGLPPPHGRVPSVPDPRALRAAQQQAQPLQPGENRVPPSPGLLAPGEPAAAGLGWCRGRCIWCSRAAAQVP